MENKMKIRDVMMVMMEGTERRGRPSREWLDDTRDWCQTDVHRLSFKAQDGKVQADMQIDEQKCTGHIRALCPWILTMMMMWYLLVIW